MRQGLQSHEARGPGWLHLLPWVREASGEERRALADARTGDQLEDGTVILREEDFDHMGLESVRRWLVQTAMHSHHRVLYLRRRSMRATWDPELADDEL